MSLVTFLLGRRLANTEAGGEKITEVEGVPAMGLDALSSAAYGPEAALTILLPLGVAGLAQVVPITVAVLVLLFILFVSYWQTIEAYPSSGGSYTVSSENLGARRVARRHRADGRLHPERRGRHLGRRRRADLGHSRPASLDVCCCAWRCCASSPC